MSCLTQKPQTDSTLVRRISLTERRSNPPMASASKTYRDHRPGIIFLTGLSGSGKSTLATGLEQRLRAQGLLTSLVDGDLLREGLSSNLGFSDADRRENILRASELSLHLASAGIVVIVALIAP